jgi:hypothetical protein
VNRLQSRSVVKWRAASQPDVRSRLQGLGEEAACLDSTAFRSIIAKDVKRWREVAWAANLQVE